MSETTEHPDPAPEREPAPTPVPDTPAPDADAPEQTPEEQRTARDEEGRRVAQLRARLGAAEREQARQAAELEFYRRQAQQQVPAEETPEQRYMRERAQIRTEVEAQLRTETFHQQGAAAYGDWKQRCDDLVKMGADPGFAQLLVEMPDGVKVAGALAADPDAVERIANLRTERARAVALGKYAATIEGDTGNGQGHVRAAAPAVSRAPAPIRPVQGRAAPTFNEYTADGQALVDRYMRQALEVSTAPLMAASDPVTDVPTPTGTLQGVAAFSWDGSAWQPSGRAGPSVATPTGVLRGVAAFNGGPSWQPAGLAQPGVATPSGTLDGVAVYTWTGDSWAPPGGQPTPSTPSGALRGVAAFNWDGAAWQPAAQAGPSVATPYGVLDGVAMFGWSGSAWAAVGAPSLSLDFMTPGALDPRITFTRASTATYFNNAGVMQNAATNAPRWDYNPATLAPNGLLIEEARTNLVLNSGDLSNAIWTSNSGGVTPPAVTGNNLIAPDGTTTAARIVYPAVSSAGNWAQLYQPITATAAVYSTSIWLRGSVGGEVVSLAIFNGTATYFSMRATLTTSWQRFSVVSSALTAATWYILVGTDLRDLSQTSTAASTIFVWGGQFEQGAFPTSYIPTTAAAVTRAIDTCGISSANMAPWFASPGGSWQVELIDLTPASSNNTRIIGAPGTGTLTPMYIASSGQLTQYDGGFLSSAALVTVGAITKGASTNGGGAGTICLNAGTVASAPMSTGYGVLATGGVAFLTTGGTGSTDNTTGYLRRVRYWPRVLTNAELQQVTT